MKQKIIEYVLRTFLYSCVALGWWGLLYPQLSMTPDTVALVDAPCGEDKEAVQTDGDVIEWDFEGDVYWKVLQAQPEQIRLRSGLLRSLWRQAPSQDEERH